MRKIQPPNPRGGTQCEIDGRPAGCYSFIEIGAKTEIATNKTAGLLVVIGSNCQPGCVHQVHIRAANDGRHTLHFFIGLMNNGRIAWCAQGCRKQRMLGHQLRNRQVAVKLITHKLTVAERLFQAIPLNLLVTSPTAQHPGHSKGDHKYNKCAYPVGHIPAPATPLEDARVSPGPLRNKGRAMSQTQAAARRPLRWRCIKNAAAARATLTRSDTNPPSIIIRAAPISNIRTIQDAVTLPNQPSTPPESRYTPKSAVTSARAISNQPASINSAPL